MEASCESTLREYLEASGLLMGGDMAIGVLRKYLARAPLEERGTPGR